MIDESVPGFIGWLQTPTGKVPRVASALTTVDLIGSWKVRWGIGRMRYLVPPGLYAVGTPGPGDPVVVTANYKMSYDVVRSALDGRNIWMLVLETFGINVWCAAGKGTFGTGELVRRVGLSRLAEIVSHRRLLLPLLGAPGVAAHEVAKATGFSVTYAAIRASDLPAFLDNGMRTTAGMRQLTFSFRERIALIPLEFVLSLKPAAIIAVALTVGAAAFGKPSAAVGLVGAYLGAVLAGVVVTPALLPWLPGRSFAIKGMLAGYAWTFVLLAYAGRSWSAPVIIAALTALPAVSSFLGLNFTGCTTFTSRSGVRKELRFAIPLTGMAILAGAAALVTAGLG